MQTIKRPLPVILVTNDREFEIPLAVDETGILIPDRIAPVCDPPRISQVMLASDYLLHNFSPFERNSGLSYREFSAYGIGCEIESQTGRYCSTGAVIMAIEFIELGANRIGDDGNASTWFIAARR